MRIRADPALKIGADHPSGDAVAAAITTGGDLATLAEAEDSFGAALNNGGGLLDGVGGILHEWYRCG